MLDQLVESWQINHRVTLRLLNALSDDALRASLSTRGGRDVARQLAHESHHRGSILLTLKQTGHKLTDELRWGLWDWAHI